jgi:hypothetical protein
MAKCPYCGKTFKRLSAHKCPKKPVEEKNDGLKSTTEINKILFKHFIKEFMNYRGEILI